MPSLSWEGRREAVRAADGAPFLSLQRQESFGTPCGNLLIQGDNLDALKSLLPHYAGSVKCVFIDPPYNTGKAFGQYDDNLQHSQWLSLMYPRLVLLRELLADNGSIWVTIDDNEGHYLKVIMDEIFGRKNFISNFIWEKKRKASFLSEHVGRRTDHVLCYAKNKEMCPSLTFGLISENETYPLYNPGNKRKVLKFPPRTVEFWKLEDGDYAEREYAEKTSVVKLIAPLKIINGRNENELQIEGAWRYSQQAIDAQLKSGEYYVVKSKKFRPRRMVSGNIKGKKVHNLLSKSHYDMSTNEYAANEVLNLFGQENFDYPKPEKLLHFIITASTTPGDLVLDSFLGSGTTSAVAHKMGRRYIGIEMGEHAKTHCIPRLQKVIDGETGGISEAENWTGGGGFCFMTLGAPIFDDTGAILPNIKFAELAAHVWFYATKTPLPPQTDKTPFLGVCDDVGYALLYNDILKTNTRSATTLTNDTLRIIRTAAPKDFCGKLVIYGSGCRLSPRRMTFEKTEFRQIPYDCKQEES